MDCPVIVLPLVYALATDWQRLQDFTPYSQSDLPFMRRALALARRGIGKVSPNPAVGAVLVKSGEIIGEGWHRGPGLDHAEVDAIKNCLARGHHPSRSQIYVTLEPCCTHGRTPPCTDAICEHGIAEAIIGTVDPNPNHAGRGLTLLRRAGISVRVGPLESQIRRLNAAFNHWIVHQTPYVTLKTAMTLDGKIATAKGESKWITGPEAREAVMRIRYQHDAILVGIETVIQDDPSLTIRFPAGSKQTPKTLRRILLDTHARTPCEAKICRDEAAHATTIIVGPNAPADRIVRLSQHVNVWQAPLIEGTISPNALLRYLGQEQITCLLIEGGGKVNASFLPHAHRVAFFYAPKILGGTDSRPAIGGDGQGGGATLSTFPRLTRLKWKSLGPDLLLTADISST